MIKVIRMERIKRLSRNTLAYCNYKSKESEDGTQSSDRSLDEVKTFIHHGNSLLDMVIIIKTQKHYKTKYHSISVRNK